MLWLAVALVAAVVVVKVVGDALDLGGLGLFAALVVAMAALIAVDRLVLRRTARR
jgi:hypothetical protein